MSGGRTQNPLKNATKYSCLDNGCRLRVFSAAFVAFSRRETTLWSAPGDLANRIHRDQTLPADIELKRMITTERNGYEISSRPASGITPKDSRFARCNG